MNVLSSIAITNKDKGLYFADGYFYGKIGKPITEFYGTQIHIGDIIEVTYKCNGDSVEKTVSGPVIRTARGHAIHGLAGMMDHYSVKLLSSYDYVSHKIIKDHLRITNKDLKTKLISIKKIEG